MAKKVGAKRQDKTTDIDQRTKHQGAAAQSGFDMNSALNMYLPNSCDLQQKSISGNDQQKGQQSRQLCQELKRHKIIDEIDLHGLFQKDAQERLENFFHHVQAKGLRKIRIIHGKGHHSSKGKSVLQSLVWNFLQEAKAAGTVLEFHHPCERDGGKGATIVLIGRQSNSCTNNF